MSCPNNTPETAGLGSSGYPQIAAQQPKKTRAAKPKYKSPRDALDKALKRGRPDDQSRTVACEFPMYAYEYARHVDQKPHDITRAGASKNPEIAVRYALDVDQQPHDVTRAGACLDPSWSYHYARDVDRQPHDVTRACACLDPSWAYSYAVDLDGRPHDVTRAAVCTDPHYAYHYALKVDKCPRDDTRGAACEDPGIAIVYAFDVDRRPTPETARVASTNAHLWGDYCKYFMLSELEKKILLGQPFDLDELVLHPGLFEKYRDLFICERKMDDDVIKRVLMANPDLIAKHGFYFP